MFKLNLKIALRNLWKYKGYTLINISGLSIGMASCILIFIFIKYQLSFDEGFKNEDRIFRVVTNWKYNAFDDYSAGVPAPFSAAARVEFAGLEKVGAIAKRGAIIHINDDAGKEIFKNKEKIFYAEPDFFDIINVKWSYGKTGVALKEPNTVALSEAKAIQFFGSPEKALGRSITSGTSKIFKVTGIFQDQPKNSSFPLQIVMSYQNFLNKNQVNWDAVNSSSACYVLLKSGLKVADLDRSLAAFNQRHYRENHVSGNQVNAFQPLRAIHFSELYDNFAESTIAKREIYGLGIIGVFLILTACINFINLSTAQAVNRSKEVGVRKVIGGERSQLILQFLTETFALIIIALIVACVLTELVLPFMNNLLKGEVSLSLFNQPVIFLFMGVLVLLVSFLAGFYPALIISGFNPVLAINNKVSLNNNGLSLRKVLVVVQFSITIILIIGTLVIRSQMEYVRKKPLGFNTNAVAMISIFNDSLSRTKLSVFKERVLQLPGVLGLSYCQTSPLSEDVNSTDFTFNHVKNHDFEVRTSRADADFFKVFDLKIIAGKVFKRSDTANGCIVNETFLKKMHITNPQDALGKILDASGNLVPVVGVVKDYNDKSLKEEISGIAIFQGKQDYYSAALKMDPEQLSSGMKEVQKLWNSTFKNGVYEMSFVDDEINSYYQGERIVGTLFKVFAGIIIFISFIGLFGLISFVAAQRTREVAIRKILGATTYQLISMLNNSFLQMVFIANLLAWPLAYLFVSKWLAGFAYRMELTAWPFVLAMVISMFITLITVSLRSYKAATSNAVNALKYE
ncbi:putative ABC transport system permease protein [Pedobacter sp. UYP24]